MCQHETHIEQAYSKMKPESTKGCQEGTQNGTRMIQSGPCGTVLVIDAKLESPGITFWESR